MAQFNEAFLDASAYRPPTKWQARTSNLMVWLTALILLTAGWFFKDWMMTQFRYLALAEGEPAIPYPAQWRLEAAEGLALRVLDPNSQSAFPPREEVAIYPLPGGPAINAWPEFRRSRLNAYHEIERTLTTLPDGRQALSLTYSFVAETDASPTPIVVAAHDLVFVAHYGQSDNLIVMTLAADVNEWKNEWPFFQKILNQVGVETQKSDGELK